MRDDIFKALGWTLLVGFGIILGLMLGSLGADVPADAGMLVFMGSAAAGGTLAVRTVMLLWKHRPGVRRRVERA